MWALSEFRLMPFFISICESEMIAHKSCNFKVRLNRSTFHQWILFSLHATKFYQKLAQGI